jgi:hypothetical protein
LTRQPTEESEPVESRKPKRKSGAGNILPRYPKKGGDHDIRHHSIDKCEAVDREGESCFKGRVENTRGNPSCKE